MLTKPVPLEHLLGKIEQYLSSPECLSTVPPSARSRAIPAIAASLSAGLDREPIRVLVIDTEEGMREGLRRIFEKRGCIAHTAADGESALRLLAESPCEVALVPLSLRACRGRPSPTRSSGASAAGRSS